MVESERTSAEVTRDFRGRPADSHEGEEARPDLCYHCGAPCPGSAGVVQGGRSFCCQGCSIVHELLAENGLTHFYELSQHPGVRVSPEAASRRWDYLDDPSVRSRLLDFEDQVTARVTFRIPTIHCIACVWLLENLFRLHPAVGQSRVNFGRRELMVTFAPDRMRLSELVELLHGLGYGPSLSLGELERPKADVSRRRRALQVGVAGFAFGNIMLLSLPLYLGLDSFNGEFFRKLFGWLSLVLALPVVVFSAADYWRAAWMCVRRRILTLDVPIALGVGALYSWSIYEILWLRGEGYLDSLAGLVFFLLCGRIFQEKTYDRIAFDRDYRSFFPLAVTRRRDSGQEETISISRLDVGDRLVLRHGELLPADARLVEGAGFVDYSFVTGESVPVAKRTGDLLYAGGLQMGGVVVVETVKPVSESYLTSLWGHAVFRKPERDDLESQTNRYGRRFTALVLAVALGAAVAWAVAGQMGRGIKAFASVLIVACPCALALAAPTTLGTAQRLLARSGVFVRNAQSVERLSEVDYVVLDKTGTLTVAGPSQVSFRGAVLSEADRFRVASLTRQSVHPLSVRIGEWLRSAGPVREVAVARFEERPGEGLSAVVDGVEVQLGSRLLLEGNGVSVVEEAPPEGSVAHLAVGGIYQGRFEVKGVIRPGVEHLTERLKPRYGLMLLSGDQERERAWFARLLGAETPLHFGQSPLDKLRRIESLQVEGRKVMMVGDGLNDAGALKQSDVGVAVVEQAGCFSPASDVILEGTRVAALPGILALAQRSARLVRISFGISAAYNLVGVAVAAAGWLSPILCAVLMPLSSATVVVFACVGTRFAARRLGILELQTAERLSVGPA